MDEGGGGGGGGAGGGGGGGRGLFPVEKKRDITVPSKFFLPLICQKKKRTSISQKRDLFLKKKVEQTSLQKKALF